MPVHMTRIIPVEALPNAEEWPEGYPVFFEGAVWTVQDPGAGKEFRQVSVVLDDDANVAYVGDRDLEVVPVDPATANRGIVMQSPNGVRWRLTPSNAGEAVFTDLTI